MNHTSYIEISKSAYKKNIQFIRSEVGEKTTISAVIKGNAYGHGIENIVSIAEGAGIRHFSAFSADEAIRVYRASKRNSQIMIMGMLENEDLEELIKKGISFFVFEFDRLEETIKAAQKLQIKAKIHVEVETGFHRTGFEWEDREALLKMLEDHQDVLVLAGLCTHYAGAESITNYVRVRGQIEKYHAYKDWLIEKGLSFERFHTACSAATFSYPETIMDMVRIGIASYGFWPTQETYMYKFKSLPENNKNPLKRLISWKSSIMSLKKVKMGDFIGYGSSYMAPRDMLIALVPIGYSHGFSRLLSNQGKVLISGKIVSVVGTVTMNSIAVDITDLKGVEKGDEVVLIGKQKKNEITVASFGESIQQVNYELLTRLPLDIPRKIIV
ncbi:alanine racemase [Belliella aquatica]|uniref:Alanine racemase n=1 Tax=Belliella aquatica TaxID=1323734 RepID=A0ABQ1LL15_9BACT|nr:alanine racemase [Belliella aquatica]MCH7404089.1 alanine racemase [Belliella aquatica]GGC25240.1 alanine racemase [Belliella aquatica]